MRQREGAKTVAKKIINERNAEKIPAEEGYRTRRERKR